MTTTLPPPDPILKAELEELGRSLRPPTTDWKVGLLQHPWLVVVIVGLGGSAIGAMSGRVTSIEAREHQEIRDQQSQASKDYAVLRRDVDDLRRSNAQWMAQTQEALNALHDLQRENYLHYRAEALARGDVLGARRLGRKLETLTEAGQ